MGSLCVPTVRYDKFLKLLSLIFQDITAKYLSMNYAIAVYFRILGKFSYIF